MEYNRRATEYKKFMFRSPNENLWKDGLDAKPSERYPVEVV